MAFKLRVGASNMPVGGHTVRVYETGTTNLVSPLFTPDSVAATLSNPFTVPVEGWYGFEPPNNNRIDVYWDEGARLILEDANVRDIYLDSGDPLPQYLLSGEEQEYIDLDTSITISPDRKDGRLYWNNNDKTIDLYSNGSTLQIGQESWIRGLNKTGATISNGTAVSIVGAQGNLATIAPTNCTDYSMVRSFVGVTTDDIGIDEVGFITTFGVVNDLYTGGFSAEGVSLYVDEVTPGLITEMQPVSGYICRVGVLLTKDELEGRIHIDTNRTPKFVELSGSPTYSAGNVLYSGLDSLSFTSSGTVGQVLTCNGVFPPTWEDPTGGGGGGDVTVASVTDDVNYNVSFVNISSGVVSTLSVNSTKLFFNPSTGTLNTTVFNSLSDVNFKRNIQTIGGYESLDIINHINPVEFNWRDTGNLSSGVIAQELENVLPHLVKETNGIKSVNYDGIIAYLIGAVKELTKKVKDLENK